MRLKIQVIRQLERESEWYAHAAEYVSVGKYIHGG